MSQLHFLCDRITTTFYEGTMKIGDNLSRWLA